MLTIIPMWKMLLETKGKRVGLAVLASFPIFVFGGIGMFFEGLQSGKNVQAAMGLFGTLFFGLGASLSLPQKKYIPEKSFIGYRSKQDRAQKMVKYGYLILAAIVIIFAILLPEMRLKSFIYGLSGLLAIYTLSKSLKFHEDVDFSANEYLSYSLGIKIGEKVLASYQNFDANDIKKGSNAFAATATKLVIASFDGQFWKKLSRDLNQITCLGIIADQNQNYFVKLHFNDGTEALLCIGLYDKLTSSPILVIKRFLEAIDASILGGATVLKSNQRRRVMADSASTKVAPIPSETIPVPKVSARNIELTPAILDGIRNAPEVTPGRKLEL